MIYQRRCTARGIRYSLGSLAPVVVRENVRRLRLRAMAVGPIRAVYRDVPDHLDVD